jgi:hypothetical protein
MKYWLKLSLTAGAFLLVLFVTLGLVRFSDFSLFFDQFPLYRVYYAIDLALYLISVFWDIFSIRNINDRNLKCIIWQGRGLFFIRLPFSSWGFSLMESILIEESEIDHGFSFQKSTLEVMVMMRFVPMVAVTFFTIINLIMFSLVSIFFCLRHPGSAHKLTVIREFIRSKARAFSP